MDGVKQLRSNLLIKDAVYIATTLMNIPSDTPGQHEVGITLDEDLSNISTSID